MARTRCRAPGRTTPTSATSRTRACSYARSRAGRWVPRVCRVTEGPARAALLFTAAAPLTRRRLERQVLAVHDVHDVVVPAHDLGLHQVLVDVEVQWQERVIAQHEPLGLLGQRAPPWRVGFGRGAGELRGVGGAAVVGPVAHRVTLQL